MAAWGVRAWIRDLTAEQVQRLSDNGLRFRERDQSGQPSRFADQIEAPTAADALAEFTGRVAGALGDELAERIDEVRIRRVSTLEVGDAT
ncbi:hypothetical protein ACQP25_44925 (plasmid) [Microtetraspora malaysiensis]|uniref:hypothetical protein n=1 Tax=Microtetraspora malaysiensis TaxID=161358 RepID=UPI003D8DBEBB